MFDRVEETLETIETEPWLTQTDPSVGVQHRLACAKQIRERLPDLNRHLLNRALSLSGSRNNNAHEKKIHRGVRAIMLAQFTMRGTDLGEAPVLKSRWMNQPESIIRKGFLSNFSQR